MSYSTLQFNFLGPWIKVKDKYVAVGATLLGDITQKGSIKNCTWIYLIWHLALQITIKTGCCS